MKTFICYGKESSVGTTTFVAFITIFICLSWVTVRITVPVSVFVSVLVVVLVPIRTAVSLLLSVWLLFGDKHSEQICLIRMQLQHWTHVFLLREGCLPRKVAFFAAKYGYKLYLLVTSVLKGEVQGMCIRRSISERTSDTTGSYSMFVASDSIVMAISESNNVKSRVAVCSSSVSGSPSVPSFK